MPANNFTPNMPAAGNSLGFTRPLVNANFANYRENMELNHGNVNGTDFGKHKFLQIPSIESQAIPSPTTLANESALYSRENPASSGQIHPYFRRESDGGETGLAFLNGTIAVAANGTYDLFDFTGYPAFYGFAEARINNHIDQARSLCILYNVAGTLSQGFLVQPSGTVKLAWGSGGFSLGSAGMKLQIVIVSGVTLPSTVSWTFSGYYFQT